MKFLLQTLIVLSLFTGCLRTRSEVGESEQNNVYGQKTADNQMSQAKPSQGGDSVVPTIEVDEKDELVRNLNGRVEVLENQIQGLSKEREEERKQYEAKLVLLQEALTKLEAEMHPTVDLDSEKKAKEAATQSSDEQANTKKADKTEKNETKLTPLQAGEEFYAKQDWKKAILSFHQYTDASPKGKYVPDAKYKIGICFQQLGMKEEAMAYFEEVAANYASTGAGKKSKSRLAKLKK